VIHLFRFCFPRTLRQTISSKQQGSSKEASSKQAASSSKQPASSSKQQQAAASSSKRPAAGSSKQYIFVYFLSVARVVGVMLPFFVVFEVVVSQNFGLRDLYSDLFVQIFVSHPLLDKPFPASSKEAARKQ
jgi:hypothetical protein